MEKFPGGKKDMVSNIWEAPKKVRDAHARDDGAALSAMGRKGAQITNEKKALKRLSTEAFADRRKEHQDAEAAFRLEQSGEHIVPPQE